jgi:2-methylcitrate dehydratase PrpD
VRDADIIALRKRITAFVDSSVGSDEARLCIKLRDGGVIHLHVPHAIGSVARPMSNADLERKFRGLTKGIIDEDKTSQLIDFCWNLGELETVADIAKSARAPSYKVSEESVRANFRLSPSPR